MLLTLSLTFCFAVLAFAVVREIAQHSRIIAGVILGYVGILTGLSLAGVFSARAQNFPPLALEVMNVFFTVLIVSLFFKRTRQAWLSIPTKRLAMWHWVRVPVGISFVILAESEELAPEFGFCAGVGDVVMGLWAVAYVFTPFLNRPLGTSIWNAAAFGDTLASLTLATLTMVSPLQIFRMRIK